MTFSSSQKAGYRVLKQDEEGEPLMIRKAHSSCQRGLWLVSILNITLFIWTISSIAFGDIAKRRVRNRPLNEVNTYSPLLEEIDIQFYTTRVNGSLFNDPPTIWRDPPSNEVDAAWDEIAKIELFTVSGDEVRRMGKDPGRTAQAPESWGLGADRHIVQLDGQHVLHCLNSLRKYAHYDYYYRPQYGDKLPALHEAHKSHCTHILLQALTCQPSVNLITHDWMEEQKHPWPDFNIERKCQNHDAWIEYQSRKKITTEQWRTIPIPDNVVKLPLLPQLGDMEDPGDHRRV
ncbi:uncharacterized protein BDR25DRAFT_295678 [Lindgomyces ingoldianus]|uniref:Uncharacterized protein n=1 Tax=Lindgomyces ingoldianus TaxID=673940 RepID=A0ACB6QEC9_9PLEO|nr:uncharacterized protein BDR25DRAFT_295678 [Lindgomyces ingoldianus]KAF2465210.1 hypothetical protein BDR25DRAFT_295678 [Lindgomyces ingoldianus]